MGGGGKKGSKKKSKKSKTKQLAKGWDQGVNLVLHNPKK